MKTYTRFLATSASAVAFAAMAFGASAATYVDPWTVSNTGGISVVFGDNGLDVPGAESIAGETTTTHAFNAQTGVFTDTFSFFLPNGLVGFSLSSIGFLPNSSLNVSSLTFNGVPIGVTNTSNGSGNAVTSTSGAFSVALGGPQTLSVSGIGGADAVFSGTATFQALTAGVPEPGAWALMIVGFAGTGALLRRRRGQLTVAAS